MTVTPRPFSRIASLDWESFWHGTGYTRAGLGKLFWSVLRFLLCGWLWGTAVRLAQVQEPVKAFGAILALASIALLIWAIRGLWQGFRILGLKRLLLTLLIAYGLVVAFNVLTIPDERPVIGRIVAQLARAGQQAWDTLTGAIGTATRAPDEFLFAYTGERAMKSPPPGIPTPDPQATPIVFHVRAGGGGPSPTLRIGGYAQVYNTGGDSLRARAGPGTSFDIVARLPEGNRLLVLDGPTTADGYRWWKVRDEQGEGWCADRWLRPSP